MICLRSGYCCTHYDVVIVNDPKLGPRKDNLVHKPTGVRCQHLLGQGPGQYSCAIHEEPWYVDTPCYRHTQVEHRNSPCRMGEYTLKAKPQETKAQ